MRDKDGQPEAMIEFIINPGESDQDESAEAPHHLSMQGLLEAAEIVKDILGGKL